MNVTTIKTEKNAFLTCGFVGKITFVNSALASLKTFVKPLIH